MHLVDVPRPKVVDYLLSDTHVVGRHKAVMFRSLGFSVDKWRALADALLRHAAQNEVTVEEPSPFGRRFVVDGIMEAANGRRPVVRSVWFLRHNESTPRFVTAYPLRKRGLGD